jgi:hypothetical protein
MAWAGTTGGAQDGPGAPGADHDGDGEVDRRLRELMQSAGLGGGGGSGDQGRRHGVGQVELERLMGQMAQLRDHGGGLGDVMRRERRTPLALEAARLRPVRV